MRRLYIGLLGTAIGFLSASLPPSLWIGRFVLPGLLFGLALLWFGGDSSWGRRILALCLCLLGYPAAFAASFVCGLVILELSSPAVTTLFFPLLFALAGATGSVLTVWAWRILKGSGFPVSWQRPVLIGALLAQAGLAVLFDPLLYPNRFDFTFDFSVMLSVWCAGMLILVDTWARDSSRATYQPQPQT